MRFINKIPVRVTIPTETLDSVEQMAMQIGCDVNEALNIFLIEAMKDKKIKQSIYNRVSYLKRKNVVKYRSKSLDKSYFNFKMSESLYDLLYTIDKIYDNHGFSLLVLKVAFESINQKGADGILIGRVLNSEQPTKIY